MRAASPSPAAVTSWGHPVGKAVVYIPPSGTRLRRIYPGTQRRDDISGRPRHYVNVIYHPSGLAIAFVIDTGDGKRLALVEPGRGSVGSARVRGRRHQVRCARLHRGRDHVALRGRARRRRAAPARDRPDGPHDATRVCGTGTPRDRTHDRSPPNRTRADGDTDRADGRGDVRRLEGDGLPPW